MSRHTLAQVALLISLPMLVATATPASAKVDPGAYYGPVHEKRAGQVVFSSKPIKMDATDDGAAYTSYPLGKPLYIRYWAADAAANLLPGCRKPRNVLRARVNDENAKDPPAQWTPFGDYVNGEPKTRSASSLSNELDLAFTTTTTWTPGRAIAGQETVRVFNAGVVPRLRDGKNSLEIAITLDCGSSSAEDPVLARGSVAVVVPAGGVKKYLTKYGTKLPASPHKENAKLVPQIMKVMRAMADWDNETILGARVTSTWRPIRHKISGRVVRQQAEAVILVRAKDAPPEACRLFKMSYERDAAGGPLRYAGTGSSTPFPCSSAPR